SPLEQFSILMLIPM
nr:RecName: Full=ATP synthase subunit a; AltName: Full=F-ATPase protein 6 [Spinacia oleracea]AAB21943.1 F0F1 ATP synthase F0 subunit 18.5 kda protein=ATPase subunit 6 homolog {EC 3.6.1.34} [spinach, Peptide Mitochondrial Partial, 14 aa] [Spinacia oleracea]